MAMAMAMVTVVKVTTAQNDAVIRVLRASNVTLRATRTRSSRGRRGEIRMVNSGPVTVVAVRPAPAT